MSKYFVSIIIALNVIFASIYNVGDIVSNSDQNITLETCYAGNNYGSGDDWKLADWNGAANGGHYNVIFIDMSASW